MILIDAVYINDSGGLVLLEYLIKSLEDSDMEVFYLLDRRLIGNDIKIKKTNKIQFLKPSLLSRHFFYKKHSLNFSKILCFANLPPTSKSSVKTYTYFHQALFIEIPENIKLLTRIRINLKIFVLKLFKNNSSDWIVQSVNIKSGLIKNYKLNPSVVHSIPFYPPIKSFLSPVRKKNCFLYVSSGLPHKNHIALIDAFCIFYDKFRVGELQVTVSEKFKDLNNKILLLQKSGYPIVNFGFLNRRDLSNVYSSVEYLVYPSLSESFGLGIIEAIENGCKVIGADLPYMHAVCEPSLIFNPYCVSAISTAFENSIKSDIKITLPKVSNEIDKLLDKLK